MELDLSKVKLERQELLDLSVYLSYLLARIFTFSSTPALASFKASLTKGF